MGLNLVVGCNRCGERIWFYRGELEGLERFYRAHWEHSQAIALSDDQRDLGDFLMQYPDVGTKYGASGERDGA